ncbi:MAG: dTDP-4-dehydrorhamnose reductase [bacterium]
MKILVTGANGQLGQEIRKLYSSSTHKQELLFTDIAELDITDPNLIRSYIEDNNVDFIVNCAAYTAVDRAEDEEQKAELINRTAVAYLASISKEFNIPLLHISTDFVFDGKKSAPYLETDHTAPLSVYGRTKLEGEHEIVKHGGTFVIIRTSWLYSEFGGNFVKTILRLAKEKKELRVVSDQVGSPTYAEDLASLILEIIPKINSGTREIFNYSDEGVASWYDLAKAILEIKQIDCTIIPIETADYPTPAKRPSYSVLDKTKIKERLDIKIPYWLDSLKSCLKHL